MLMAALVLAGLSAWRAPWRSLRGLDPAVQVPVLAIGVFAALSLGAGLNIGHRYILLLYPLLFLVAADRLSACLAPGRFAAVAAVLLAGQVASALLAGPHYLAYFNRLAGGSEAGWRLLVDSNLDWGQDLPALRDLLGGRQDVVLEYFGTALPAGYGIEAPPPSGGGSPGALAISATHLQGLYLESDDPFREFRSLAPSARAGHSILLFELDSPEARRALDAAVGRLERADGEPEGNS